MKSIFGQREKFLYRRNPVVSSFIAGTKFGLLLAGLAYLIIRLV